jgi:catechol 2,3-dioxygenase-like lactoylglutathione lyase family enzyme
MIKEHMYVLPVPNLSRSGEFYRDVLGFEVREMGDEILKPLRDEPWGMREFGLRTVDGHRLMLGSPIGTAGS